MFVETLSIQNLRSLELLSFKPNKQLNIILGKNNAGKTTILESIYIASRLKTFKQTPIPNLIKHQQKFLKLQLNVAKSSENHLIVIEKSLESHNIAKNNSKLIGTKEIARLFPVLSLAFGQENIINLPAESRRSLLDWGLFHVEQTYLSLLQNYQRCLRQRNFLLKKGKPEEIDYWTTRMAEIGENVSHHRKNHFQLINEAFKKFVEIARLNENKPHEDIALVGLEYYQGWDEEEGLLESIKNNLPKDRANGFTEFGPHKADILVKAKELELKRIGSMSSQVLASLLLVLAQAEVFHMKHNYKPILLIDDLFFGIDDTNLMLMLELLIQVRTQCFLTAPDIYKGKLVEISHKRGEIELYTLDNKQIVKAS